MQRFPRYSRRATLITAALTLLSGPVTRARAAGPRDTDASDVAHLVIDRDFPDPDVIDVDGTRYAYATNSGGTNVQVATADALDGPWRRQPDALPSSNLPEWVGPDAQGFPNVWAPDVSSREEGTFLLYYSAFHPGNQQQCLGAATAESPGGPFVPAGPQPLVCGPGRGDIIDPASFVDSDGCRYLLYKDSRGARARGGPATIRLRPVAADGLTQQGPETVLLRSTRPEEAGIVEAPTLVRRPEGYVLFYSANAFDSGRYFTNYATSSALTGPYTKAPGAFLSKDKLGGEVTDPGGQDVVADASHIVFHGDLAEPGGPRGMYLAELRWNGLHPVLIG
ncbi:glycoside hydrolase family 43 protein [Haloactinomyces albus]|uniref:Beta-xylosidase n=1 Tax=Haloactinomyces albus TaxID=1352928 RepID=A0AAE4CML0_9ACTN|nr:glycoside hydrolase family 43 protein [Haloactinomyces albus]MDR7302531.1 beta-xylosidase [Haloactinomyces albus]